MRVLVCGSRHCPQKIVFDTLNLLACDWPYEVTIIAGAARGADTHAADWAGVNQKGLIEFPADWNTHGKAAGPIRNTQMLREGKPDLVIAFLAPNSRGTANMISQAEKARVPVKVIHVP